MAAVRGRHTGYGGEVLDGRFDGPQPHLRKFVIPGAERTFNWRDGSIGFLQAHWWLWWHETIEHLDLPGQPWDEWGWADRNVRDSASIVSEHAGGRAGDGNATLHPRGVPISRTFTKKHIQLIDRRLNLYRYHLVGQPTLGWGGRFHTVVDGMHVEVADGATLAMCESVARRLMKTPRGRRILKANPGLREVVLS